METVTLLGFGACTPDAALRASLPFPAGDIDRAAIPPPLRRRTSQATQLAFTAADRACAEARRSPRCLPAVFASAGGEIRITDSLCIELGRPDGVISPTAFHNSVHNTAAGYWSIAHQCPEAASATAAGHATFAMALLEAWSHLATQGGEMLLVCYDEAWPGYLAPPMGSPPFAAALVLGAGPAGGLARIGRPQRGDPLPLPARLETLIENMPAAAAIPLLAAVGAGEGEREVPLAAAAGWRVRVSVPKSAEPNGQ
jgi:hypothetical protein